MVKVGIFSLTNNAVSSDNIQIHVHLDLLSVSFIISQRTMTCVYISFFYSKKWGSTIYMFYVDFIEDKTAVKMF